MGRDLSPGELLSARNFLDPGLSCQAAYRPEHRIGAQVPRVPAREEPLLAGLDALPDDL
jgi:hypothetical protein